MTMTTTPLSQVKDKTDCADERLKAAGVFFFSPHFPQILHVESPPFVAGDLLSTADIRFIFKATLHLTHAGPHRNEYGNSSIQ